VTVAATFFWAPRLGAGSDWMDWASPPWYADAACGEHPDLEFVLLPLGTRSVEIEQRKAICRGCLVREECLAYALADGSLDGVWGGTTKRKRQELRGGANQNANNCYPPAPI
jgi:WhiB family redox-sensing transcriptional regulator